MKIFQKKEFFYCLPVHRYSYQLIAWVFQYAPWERWRHAILAHASIARLAVRFWAKPKPKGKTKYSTRYACIIHTKQIIPFATLSHGLWLALGKAQTRTLDEVFHSLDYPWASNPNTRRSISFTILPNGSWLGLAKPKPKDKTKYSIWYTIPLLGVGFGRSPNPNTRRSIQFTILSHGLWMGLGEAQTQTQDEVF